MLQLSFNSISEPKPGPKWQALFNTHWPAYKAWFQSKGADKHPGLQTSIDNLKRYMPRFLPTYERLCSLAGNDTVAERFLTGYQPPAYISACSQVVLKQTPMLIRNYDYHPHLSEGTVFHSAWNGKKVMGVGDCLWGIVDGINEDGLVASLTFGGRKAVGKGFGIPFILRYVLEFCGNVAEAVETLTNIPSHMSYNIMVLDKTGNSKLLQLSPDRAPVITDALVSTNHQGKVDWPEHAAFSKTIEREDFILENINNTVIDSEEMISAFLEAPLFNRQYNDGFGTVYTSIYKPLEKSMALRWPGKQLVQALDNFKEGEMLISYQEKAIPALAVERTVEIPAGVSVPGESWQPTESYAGDTANYWINYGNSWANGTPASLGEQVARSIVDSLGLPAGNATEKLMDQFMSENKRRGQVPWEMLADLWASVGSKAEG